MIEAKYFEILKKLKTEFPNDLCSKHRALDNMSFSVGEVLQQIFDRGSTMQWKNGPN